MIRDTEITVLGGGIAGLACGLALARQGARVRVLEQAPALAEVGAGLQISPNGFAVLEALGLADAVHAASTGSTGVVLRRGADGARLLRMALEPGAFRFIHRADLIAVLAEGCRAAGVELRCGLRVHRVDTGPDGTTLHLDTGPEAAALLVGADGVRSVLRGALNGDAAPFFTGQVAWRALIPDDGTTAPEASVFVGPGRHLVRYPLAGRGVVNLVGVEERAEWAAESWAASGDPDAFRAAFAGFCPEVREQLDRVQTVKLWGLFRHPVADRWHNGSAALIGDAAHPTLPFLAQGANLALEDAFVLARCLAGHPVDAALRLYQRQRRDRVVRAIAAANSNARNYHLSRRWKTLPAHTALRLLDRLAPGLMVRRFDWLYRHDVTKG